MNLLIWYLYDKQHGGGHKYRCHALANKARRLGHNVRIVSNDTGADYMLGKTIDLWVIQRAVRLSKCDWLIVDLEEAPPDWITQVQIKKCNLNGPGWLGDNGHTIDQGWADLVWIQDDPKRVILRQSVLDAKWQGGDNWFVFGGSADPLKLLPRFDKYSDYNANLVGTTLSDHFVLEKPNHHYIVTNGDLILPYMVHSAGSVLHMGITAFETAALSNGKMPIYLFSKTPGHLHYAQNMEALGYAKAYPTIGLPEAQEFTEFIQTPYKPCGPKIDGKAIDRLLKELQRVKR